MHGLLHVLDHPDRVRAVAVSPDGKTVLTACEDERARLWDTATGACAWESEKLGGPVFVVAFSPDGQRFAAGACQGGQVGSGVIRQWDRATRRPTEPTIKMVGYVLAIAWSPDGKSLATGGGGSDDRDGVRVWDAATGAPRGAPRALAREYRAVAWSPDGQTLAGGDGPEWASKPASVRCWNAAGAHIVPVLPHPRGVAALAFSPDGRKLLTGCDDRGARLWEAGTGKLLGEPLFHPDGVFAVAFTPDGQQFVTACDDGLVRFWDTATRREQGAPVRHHDKIRALAVSRDGRFLATASFDRTVRLWSLSRQSPGPVDPSNPAAVRARRDRRESTGAPPQRFRNAVFSPDRTAVALVSADGHLARVMSTAPVHPLGRPVRYTPEIMPLAFFGIHTKPPNTEIAPIVFGPAGRFATGTHGDDQSRVWSVATGEPLTPPLWHANFVQCLAFSPDGKLLAAGDYFNVVRLWNTGTGRESGPPLQQGDIVMCLAFSPNGKLLATGTSDDRSHTPGAWLWDVASRRPIGPPMPHATRVNFVQFRPDGRALMTATWDRVVRLWDTATGKPLGPPAPPLGGELTAVTFSPDGRLLATAGKDGIARLWDAHTGALSPVGSLPHPAGLVALAFSLDGRTLATGSEDGGARLWDVSTCHALGPRIMQPGPVLAVSFTSDGRSLLTAASDGVPRSWPVPEPMAENDLDRLRLRLEVNTGRELVGAATTEELTPQQWQERRRRLVEQEGSANSAYAAGSDDRAWHEARLRDAEANDDSFAALWHLERLSAPGEDWHLHARRAMAHAVAGRLDLAGADHGRALPLAPKQALRDWYWHGAVDRRFSRQWPAALWCLDRAVALAPDEARLYQERAYVHGRLGHAAEEESDLDRARDRNGGKAFLLEMAERYARRGLWQRSADCFLRVRQTGQGFPLTAAPAQALAQLWADDSAGYRQACGWMTSPRRVGGSIELFTADSIVWACALGSDGVTDYAPLVRLAEAVVAKAAPPLQPGTRVVLGSVLYRAGRYPESIARLEQWPTTERGPAPAQVWAFLAMAHHQLGHAEQARQCLNKVPALAPANDKWSWDALEVEVLRREAEALVRGAAPKPRR